MKRLLLFLFLLLFAIQTIPYLNDGRRFHPDEAFFMTFARHAAIGGDWWLQGSLDKPPLTIYANALMIATIGADTLPDGVLILDPIKGEFVGRLFSFFCGLVLVAVTMRLALDLSKHTLVALIGGVVLATLPMMHLYSASAFMDMPMVVLAMAALLVAVRRKAGMSGILLALAFAAKPQAVFFAPLVVWFVINPIAKGNLIPNPSPHGEGSYNPSPQWRRGRGEVVLRNTANVQSILRFGMALSIGLALLFLWDALRLGDSVFALGATNNNFFAPTLNFETIVQRTRNWLPYPTNAPVWFNLLTGISLFVGLFVGRVRVFCAWILIYLIGHVILFDTLYMRYLLPIVPILIIVNIYFISSILSLAFPPSKPKNANRLQLFAKRFLLIFVILYSTNFWSEQIRKYTIAFESNNYEVSNIIVFEDYQRKLPEPFNELANYLNAKPVATVIYDHWLGWSLKYYMGEWHDKRIVYYPLPQEMVADALVLQETGTRYFVAPRGNFSNYGLSSSYSESVEQWLEAFRQAGFVVTLEKTIEGIEVYAINSKNIFPKVKTLGYPENAHTMCVSSFF